ncbi:polysaccharide biosynthesis tyrosine autokinase [Gayadomonas joobiniege]|uniref:polysaccharide biosynthesis tyrosine autokinase n=1 Tax=Gayadomonas joobiniege TaxID=1234606 RepID=UPI00037C85A0|nr:polysaccharide biosynthesis tyrosine autokinase [Gayadomonas joobiniege]
MTQKNTIKKSPRFDNQSNEDEIDLMSLVGKLFEQKVFIIAFTGFFTLLGVAYALFSQPFYRANAVIQIEQKSSGVPALSEMGDMFTTESDSVTEIELIRSRSVVGKAVDQLNLDIYVEPNFYPIFGNFIYRKNGSDSGQLIESWMEGYAWGGERLVISKLKVPPFYRGLPLSFIYKGNDEFDVTYDDDVLLSGSVKTSVKQNGFEITVKEIVAHPETEFVIAKLPKLQTVLSYQKAIAVNEKGKSSGILEVVHDSHIPERARLVVDAISRLYVRQNVERNSAEATKSLDFLKDQLPELKLQLEKAEQKFNDYQVSAESVNIQAETESLLTQIVEVEKQISGLQLKKVDIERKFKPDHPTFQALQSQLNELNEKRESYQQQVKSLPKTQQELLRLRRDVEVSTEIYTQMLNNIQELDIIRAGTIGNVRIIDEAIVNTKEPVKPRKKLIVIVAFILGGLISIVVVLVRAMFNRGVENPEQIEELGLPVYAAIPYSDSQESLEKKFGRKFKQLTEDNKKLLAVSAPTDLSVEALRSLRTSLHFAMMEAKNNIVMISGPSPAVGKSFVSANLAATVAQAGQKVLLIDADMRKGYVHKMFGLESEKGLSDYLAGQLQRNELEIESYVENLSVIGHGTVPPNPSELLMSEKFTKLMIELSETYDLVLIDTPPVLAVTDASIVGKLAGTSMLVTRFRLNPLKEIEVAARRFEQNGIDIKGVIFNAVERKAGGYGYGYGYGYYTYEYRDNSNKQ